MRQYARGGMDACLSGLSVAVNQSNLSRFLGPLDLRMPKADERLTHINAAAATFPASKELEGIFHERSRAAQRIARKLITTTTDKIVLPSLVHTHQLNVANRIIENHVAGRAKANHHALSCSLP